MNRVPMARHGLILRENEATGSRKGFKYLPGLRETIKIKKWLPKSKNPQTPYFTVYSYIDCISCLGSHAGIIITSSRYPRTRCGGISSMGVMRESNILFFKS